MTKAARLSLPCIGFALLLVVWQVAGDSLGSAILAPPTQVAGDYVSLIGQGNMLTQLVLSLRQAAIGYVAACLVGMPVGIAMGRSRLADAICHPWVSMLVVTSTAAMIPLLMLFLVTGATLRVVVIFFAVVFYVILATYNGAKSINPNQLAVGTSFGASRWRIFYSIALPSLYPYLLTAARIGLVHAVRSMVTVELYIIVGYGGLIHQTGLSTDTGFLLGLLFTLMVTSLVLDAMLRAIGRYVAPWYEQQRISTLRIR